MIVEEIFAEVHIDTTGSYLKVLIGQTPFYIHESVIPGGIAQAPNLHQQLVVIPQYELLEKLLTPADMGGLQAQINPGEDLGFICDNQGLFQTFSFDEETTITRKFPLSSNNPHGVIRINIYTDTPDGMYERTISIEFGIDYPLVAQFMSKAHPQSWVYEFFEELDGKTDALEIAYIYRKYKRDNDPSWMIGLPVFSGGVQRSDKSDFIHRVVECEALPLISSGHELITLAHLCQIGQRSADQWLEEHKSLIPEIGHERRLVYDLGL